MYFEMEPTGFADTLNVRYKKKRDQEKNFFTQVPEKIESVFTKVGKLATG